MSTQASNFTVIPFKCAPTHTPNCQATPQCAIARTNTKTRNLLLGNGFSMAGAPGCFVSKPEDTKQGFIDLMLKALGSVNHHGITGSNPEEAMRLLTADLLQARLDSKAFLFNEIMSTHPDKRPKTQHLNRCARFLKHFIAESNKCGQVYTLNYDLLLYWVLMHVLDVEKRRERNDMGPDFNLKVDDGFRGKPPTWQGNAAEQNIFYLHGALHLRYDSLNSELSKRVAVEGKVDDDDDDKEEGEEEESLIKQIKANPQDPLYVLDSNPKLKQFEINKSEYLKNSHNEFKATLAQKNVTLFIFGCSLSESDAHIRKYIQSSRCDVFISVFNRKCAGAPCSCSSYKPVGGTAGVLKQIARKRVAFFCANSAKVWG